MAGPIKKFPIMTLMAVMFVTVTLAFSSLPRAWAAVPVGGTVIERPKVTDASYIALLFYKLTGNFPDFHAWAQQTPEYISAAPELKINTLETKALEFENTYSLLTLADPMIVEMPAKLSSYSALQRGFLIESFIANMYFGYSFLDTSYALIPKGIADRQWLPVPPEYADAILSQTKEGKEVIIQISLLPTYADNKTPMPLNDIDHWLILTEIGKISIWSSDGTRLLWESRNLQDAATPNRLLDLYR